MSWLATFGVGSTNLIVGFWIDLCCVNMFFSYLICMVLTKMKHVKSMLNLWVIEGSVLNLLYDGSNQFVCWFKMHGSKNNESCKVCLIYCMHNIFLICSRNELFIVCKVCYSNLLSYDTNFNFIFYVIFAIRVDASYKTSKTKNMLNIRTYHRVWRQ
jgi:hypothetical protein